MNYHEAQQIEPLLERPRRPDGSYYPPVMTDVEVIEFLRLEVDDPNSRNARMQLKRLRDEHGLPFRQLGKHYRYPLDRVLRWVNQTG